MLYSGCCQTSKILWRTCTRAVLTQCTLKSFDAMAKQTAAYGMELLSALLTQLADGLKMRRHQIRAQGTQDGLAGVYTKLSLYIDLCEEKIELDKGIAYYGSGAEGQD